MNDRLVLCYHAVSGSWPSTLAVSPERLRAQVGFLLNRGYQAMTFDSLFRSADRGGDGKALAVTFDDGCRSVLERALPVLSELGAPATLFVPTGYVGRAEPMSWPGIDQWSPGRYEKELLPLDWVGLRRLAEAGWEIASHSVSHPYLTDLGDAALATELRESKRAIERELGGCRTIAYPYGDHDERVVAAASEAGYVSAAIMTPGPEERFRWPRIGIYPVDDRAWRFRLKVSPPLRRLRSSRLGIALENLR